MEVYLIWQNDENSAVSDQSVTEINIEALFGMKSPNFHAEEDMGASWDTYSRSSTKEFVPGTE